MTRPTIGLLLILGLLVVPLGAAAPSAHVPRIGVLSPFSPATGSATGDLLGQAMVDAFRQGLQALGYREGQTLHIEYRWAEGHPERLAELAADLVRLPVDVLVTMSMRGVRAAQHATATIPIVSGGAGDLVRGGLVASLARPGGNITGVTNQVGPEFHAKRLQLLLEAVPGVTRVAALQQGAFVRAVPTRALMQQAVEEAARRLGVHLQVVEVDIPDELEGAFAAMTREGAEALLMFYSPFFTTHRRRLMELVAQHRLPGIYESRTYVEAGGLMSYNVNNADLFRRAATYVDKILKGAKPADFPVEQPTTFELVLNLKTAEALGLTIPPTLLFQADEVSAEPRRLVPPRREACVDAALNASSPMLPSAGVLSDTWSPGISVLSGIRR